MQVKDALQVRRSIRRFTQDPVSREQIEELLHAAMSGPSACNKQPWQFYAVTRAETLEALRGASRFSSYTAPLAMVVCGDLSRALPGSMGEYWIQDCSAAVENILLQAVALELGAVWCGLYPQKQPQVRVRELLGMPEEHVPLALIWIGYPAQGSEPGDRYDPACIHFVE